MKEKPYMINFFENTILNNDDTSNCVYEQGFFSHTPFDVRNEIDAETSLCERHIEHGTGLVCTRLMTNRPTSMSDATFNRAIIKVSSFVELMEFDFATFDDELLFDEIDDNCIDISFCRRKDMKLNIYFDEADIDNSVNEAFLSFISKGKLKIMNDSLPNIVDVIKQLL